MASVLIRETERAAIITLKAYAPLIAILPKTSIDPQPKTAGFDAQGAPVWPFVRLDASQAIPRGRGCTARSEVRFRLHSFAKPRFNSSSQIIETAKDHAGRLNDAVVEAIHSHAYEVAGRRYRFIVSSADLMQDGAEADAYHGIAAIVARAYQG
ncbi:hypothetical protein V474_07730 [Novosphingobium barchaimii LL02]|uniref:Uncharacterized protein n=1 Tax=Novosphingobium barchaimii LL02 TaxID=1114963 RepID=A0A0J7Y7R4_9SPHN|nr:DUF3168 domain-containing protein [Novosphingobium barchaimii]KMS59979.1 hypothetical protein V474_07730 [Novosphingobium barchaimii LL02]